MSVLDQFREAEQRVARRLKELEPAVAEYRELEEVAKRLGIDMTTAAQPSPGRSARARTTRAASTGQPRRRRTTRARATRAANDGQARSAATSAPRARSGRSATPGQRDQQLRDLVRSRPGITVKEAGAELGVDPTGLYRVVRRLEQRGEVRKSGRQLQPAGTDS